MEIRQLQESDRVWAAALISAHFGSPTVVSRERLHDTAALPGLVAWRDGRPVGLLQFHADANRCEVVVLIAEPQRQGIGTALLKSLQQTTGGSPLWLVTTNDNSAAQAFYIAAGFELVARHEGAVARARMLKPEIPLVATDGQPIEDELEFELRGCRA
jgi:GNAT superfamily N-acetyltransferase